MKNAVLIALLFLLVQTNYSQNAPEIFVQTGHMQAVNAMTVSPDGKFLVSGEKSGYQKIWEMSSGRELRTLKFNGFLNGLVFLDNARFIMIGKGRGEIYNTAGEKLDTIPLTGIKPYSSDIYITPNLKYFYSMEKHDGGKVSLYDVKDGAKIRLPEDKDDYESPLLYLGNGYFGFFYDSYGDDKSKISNIGNTDFVIYDQDLKVRKRGMIKGQIYIGNQLKVDADLKYVYKNRNFGDNANITIYDLDSGAAVRTFPGKKGSSFELLSDNRIIMIKSVSQGEGMGMVYNTELNIYECMDNGAYKEKKLPFTGLNVSNPLYITGQGQIILNLSRNQNSSDLATDIKLFDIASEKDIHKFGIKPLLFQNQAYANGRILNIGKSFNVTDDKTQVEVFYNYNIWNLKSASLEVFNLYNSSKDVFKDKDRMWIFKDAEEFYKKVPKEFFEQSYKENKYYDDAISPMTFLQRSYSELFEFKWDSNIQQTSSCIIAVNKSVKKEAARFYAFTDGEWIVMTPEGYFNASPNGAKYINVRVGSQVYSIDNFYEKYYNPAYVASVLQGKAVQPVADIRQGVALPPEVRITSPESNSESKSEAVTITISAKDMGGGIDEIKLYHNGKAIGEETRGIKISPKNGESVKSYTVTLVDGKNTFKAVGFSSDRTESNPSEIVINLLAPEKDISLFVLSVGINEYKNPALNLNYAEPDAKALADFFRNNSEALFKKTGILDVYNDQATKEGILSKLKELQNTEPQDVVLIYLAGHGESLNEKWYFIPHELTYPEREEDVIAKAISSDELSNSIKNIKAQKVLMLIDACKSGAVLLAFRGFEDRKALSQLSRATGVHVVAASSKDQFAAEVKDLGHGVFTYTLLEGLNGKAASKGENITVRKLMGYIEEQLPEITKKYRQEAQYPVVDSKGMDFPLVKGK